MGWLRTFFLGDIGNRMDIGDNEDRIRSMRKSMRERNTTKAAKDRSQDEAIAVLETDVEELKLALGTVANLLVDKGVVRSDELSRLVDLLESEAPD